MTALLDDLLQLSRVGRVSQKVESVDLGEVTLAVIEELEPRLVEIGATIELHGELPTYRTDRKRVNELFQNLIDNALKFRREDVPAKIVISSSTDGSETVIRVKDNGVGIDPRFQSRVFGLFERLDPDVSGTGIGLAIVKRIVEQHGGRIWIESKGLGHGTDFCFTLGNISKAA